MVQITKNKDGSTDYRKDVPGQRQPVVCPCCMGTNTRSKYVKAVCDDCSCIWWRDQRKPDPRALEMVNAIADECHDDDCVCWMCRAASDYVSAFPEHNTKMKGGE